MNVQQINWPPLGTKSDALMADVVARQYNAIASRLGASTLPIPSFPSDAKPRPELRYKLRSAAELLQTEPIRWRIKGVLPQRGIGAIYGASGSGKSFLAIDMAMSIAKGAEWFGYRVKPCPVVLASLEGEAGLSVRIGAYQKKGRVPDGIEFIDQPLNLLDPKDVRDLVTAIKACAVPHQIVIIDTLNRAAPGMDENSSAEMGNAINAAKLIQQAIGGLVLLVTHSGKDASKGIRGHSSLYAALDAAIEVRRSGDSREWSVAKAKDGADGTSHAFKLEIVDLGADVEGDPVSSCLIQPGPAGKKSKQLTPSQQTGMTAFMAAASGNIDSEDRRAHAHLHQWRDEFYRRSTEGDNHDSKKRAFHRARQQLVELGELVVIDDVYRLPNGFPNLS